MNRIYLIQPEGKFYKANLHCHSTNSDGKLTPEQLKELYQANGYSIIAYTDHNKLICHDYLNDENFLALVGFEADINEYTSGKCYHLNAFAKNPENAEFVKKNLSSRNNVPLSYNTSHINDYIRQCNEKGFLTMLNHPSWSLQESEDITGLENLWAFEIYNHSCEMENRTGYDCSYYNLMWRRGKRMYITATDDNHNNVPPDACNSGSCGGYVMIKSNKLEYTAVTDALEAGQFYASQAPEIYDLYIENNKLICDCSPIQSAYMITKYRPALSAHDNDGKMTHFEFPLKESYQAVRLEIFDINRKMAFSNPYYL